MVPAQGTFHSFLALLQIAPQPSLSLESAIDLHSTPDEPMPEAVQKVGRNKNWPPPKTFFNVNPFVRKSTTRSALIN